MTGVNAAMLHSGLTAMILDDSRPGRRCRPLARVARTLDDDPTTGWGANPLTGAACKGKHVIFDAAVFPDARHPQVAALTCAEQICNGCPVRDACPDRVRVA